MGIDLAVLWAIIILFGVLMYVILDGFDLGVGILFPFVSEREDRDVMVNTVAPVWDGNETWLVLGGAGLMAAFPLAYAVLLHAFYIPLLLMLLGLIFRGVAFEFRFKATPGHQRYWDVAFMGGSLVAALCKGIVLGAFVEGITMDGHRYAGGIFDWATPFSLLSGVGVVVAYALLGSTWLVLKTEGALQRRMARLARPLTWLMLACVALVSLFTPLVQGHIAQHWFSWPGMLWLAPVPILVVLLAMGLLRALGRHADGAPFVLALCLILLGYGGLGAAIWPYIILPGITIWDAAAPAQSQGFALVGALLIVPVILMYTAWSYFVFRGKVKRGEGYH